MTIDLDIRESQPGDMAAIEALYSAAFPDEDLLPVVTALLKEKEGVLSLAAITDGALVGHVIFTVCGVAGQRDKVSLLAPLAVSPDHQRQGVGGALVRAGLAEMRNAGAVQAFVLGDPAYYGRFGFSAEDNVSPPYPLPEDWREAWQSLVLNDIAKLRSGELTVPPPWAKRALWAP